MYPYMYICQQKKDIKHIEYNGHQIYAHNNKKVISVLNCKQFIINLNLYLKDDLPDALIYVRVFLASIKEIHLKQIADHINDILNDQSC